MTLFISLRKELWQNFKIGLPASFRIYDREGFTLPEYHKTNADFIITEVGNLEDYEEYIRYPHKRMILLGSQGDDIEKLTPLLKYSVKYFPYRQDWGEAHQYILQQYHYRKQKNTAMPFPDRSNMIGTSDTMNHLKKQIIHYGPEGETVTILGESGTGKELVARALHNNSQKQGDFVPKNCCAIPDLLLESELFGSVKGAYTDSVNRMGLFEKAHQGTLFLDEIGDISLSIQSKILRAVETKTITPLGSTEDRKIDVRIVTATSRDLKKMVEDGRFRKDLYYRINTLMIEIPPLRQRKEEIPELCGFFLEKRKIKKRLDPKAMEKLLDYNWPGNIRELKSTIRRAEIHSSYEKEIKEEHIIFY